MKNNANYILIISQAMSLGPLLISTCENKNTF